MKVIVKIIFLILLFVSASVAQTDKKSLENELLEKPLIERYVLDELKELRVNQLKLKKEVTAQITSSELSISDRALSYTADTVNNVFYIIAIVSSLLLIVGLKSLKELKENSEQIVENKITELTKNYEERLLKIEEQAKQRFELITHTQEQVEKSQQVSSLWKRAEIEENLQEKLHLYDEILKIDANDVETLVYKADTLLELDETRWALSLCNQAIELDEKYALSYWQRACANAKLKNIDLAIEDIKVALEITPSLANELKNEISFEALSEHEFLKNFKA